jgi:hypothetical protein
VVAERSAADAAGVPRGTADVDINVFVEQDRLHDIVIALGSVE